MDKIIELAIASPDGIVDCRLEKIQGTGIAYSVTILYPHSVHGIMQSKVYEHNLILNPQTGMYYFAADAMIHPKVRLLEKQLSKAIADE